MITIVAAIGRNNALGKDNQLLWRLPKDLRHFKGLTENHPVVMGRKTYESIGKPLPNRTNIVVSRKSGWFEEGILIVSTLKEALKFAKKINEKIFIIGGGEIYKQTMDQADRLEITLVDANPDADTFSRLLIRKSGRKQMKNVLRRTKKMNTVFVSRHSRD